MKLVLIIATVVAYMPYVHRVCSKILTKRGENTPFYFEGLY